MTKLKALIVTLVVGSSSVAMAQPATFSARGQISVRVGRPVAPPAPRTVVVRDHRQEAPVIRDYRVNETPYYYPELQKAHFNCGTMSITGLYNSEYGRVQLNQYGDRVTGTFESGGGGVIEGRIVGDLIYFTWRNTGENGRGVWSISGNGRINGTWGHNADNANGGAWTLTRRS